MEMLSVEVDAGGDDEEDMLMAYSDAIFDRREKSALFRSLGDPRIQQTTKSFKNFTCSSFKLIKERVFILLRSAK